jgi:predicted ribosome quality control (RQC) complex YloA/Tae2 family protein
MLRIMRVTSAHQKALPARRCAPVARAAPVSYRGTGMPAEPRVQYPPAAFDSVILAAVVAECSGLAGARVQRVLQVGPHALALALRSRGRATLLLASIDPRVSRFHVAREVDPTTPGSFAQQVHRRLEGATLRSVTAPPFERIAVLTLDALEGPTGLVIELTGRRGNIILCAGDRIIGAARMERGDPARRRIVPGGAYLPPAQPRPTPLSVSAEDLVAHAIAATRAESVDRAAWRAVLDAVGGVGPALAIEACLRAGIDPTGRLAEPQAQAAVGALREIAQRVQARAFAPQLYRDAGGTAAVYAAFPLQVYQGLHPEPVTMSVAVEAVATRQSQAARVEETRAALTSVVRQAAGRVRRALAAVDEERQAAAGAARAREFGELILAYLQRVAPGATALEVPDFSGQPVQIPLDPSRTGVENARVYFRRHAKAQAAQKRLPARQAELEAEQVFLDTLATAVAQSDALEDLWEVEQDLIAAGLKRRPRSGGRPAATSRGRVFELAGGQVVRVGRSARENDELTFGEAGPDDLWFHAHGMPGAHVILQLRHGGPDEAAVAAAAAIAAYYSAGRASGKVPVAYTQRRFVRRVRGGRPGQVQITNERTVRVTPALPSPGPRAGAAAARGRRPPRPRGSSSLGSG